jgi:hypothetical protein
MLSERQLRANSKRSTGSKTAASRAAAAGNARRHGLRIAVFSDPALSAEVEVMAKKIAGATPNCSPRRIHLLTKRTQAGAAREAVTARARTPSPYSMSLRSRRDRRTRSCIWRRSTMASRAYQPWVRAFSLPGSAPDEAPPPCIRHRTPPLTAGDRHGSPRRVLAPQRRLASIGPKLRG